MKRPILSVAVGVVLGGIVAMVAPASRPPGSSASWPQVAALGRGGFQDETSGRLVDVVVHYTPQMGEALAAVYSELFAALEPDTTVHVVTEDPEDFDDLEGRLDRLGRVSRPRLVPRPVGHPITGWAKDRFVSWVPDEQDSPRRVLLVPARPVSAEPSRLGDCSVPRDLAAVSAGAWRCEGVPLAFDGGDFAGSADLVLAGWTLMAKNPWLASLGPRDARALLSSLAGRPILLLGSRPHEVPEHHVNMFAIPLDGRRALVGDVRMGALFLRREVAARGRAGSGPGATGAEGVGLDADASPETAARFDGAAEAIAKGGFAVTRIPVVPLAGGGAYGPYVTYTNAILETFPGGRRRVYLPVFGLPELDRAATATWEQLGFEVRAVNVAPVFRGGGTLDCLVGVVRREPAP